MESLPLSLVSMPGRTVRRHRFLRAVGKWSIGSFLALVTVTGNPEGKPSESDVKAAYLFNFGKFIRLPATAPSAQSATFDICIFGQDPINRILDGITHNEQTDNRPVRVVRTKGASEDRSCAIAYIAASEEDRIAADLADVAGGETLTVSDAPHFLAQGGMIQFVLVANHVRFAVNLDAIKRTHLVLSSELLRVAVSVSEKHSVEGLP
jgi:hypothetical protein